MKKVICAVEVVTSGENR